METPLDLSKKFETLLPAHLSNHAWYPHGLPIFAPQAPLCPPSPMASPRSVSSLSGHSVGRYMPYPMLHPPVPPLPQPQPATPPHGLPIFTLQAPFHPPSPIASPRSLDSAGSSLSGRSVGRYMPYPILQSPVSPILQPQPATPPESPEQYKVDSDPEHKLFEETAMAVIRARNGGDVVSSNPRMCRVVRSDRKEDEAYRRQRDKNNQAAKESRNRRKEREIKLELKAQFLKQKIERLEFELRYRTCVSCQQSLYL